MNEEIKSEKKSRKLNIIKFGKKYWILIALILIFLFCYYIRSINTVEDRLLSFDPILQYRFTRYFAELGYFPLWDELSYYSGRFVHFSDYPPFMPYLSGLLYWLFGFGKSLMTVAATLGAVYGAMIIFPAFLLGRILSNKYGGLLAAILMGTAPTILTRTFGSSFDSDQIVLFFILLTLYLGFRFLKKPNITNFSLALMGFTGFMFAWGTFAYTFIILVIFSILYLILGTIIGEKQSNKEEKITIKPKLMDRFKSSFSIFKKQIIGLIGMFVGLILIGWINGIDVIKSVLDVAGFAQKAEVWIVNISIAELQSIDLLNIYSWITAMGRFTIGSLDILLFIVFVVLIGFGLVRSYKKNLLDTSFILTLLLIGIYTISRGVRFTEFSSALFITLVAVGFGYLVMYKDNVHFRTISIGLFLTLFFIASTVGLQSGMRLGPDINSDWDNTWKFLKENTPESSIVGTWWDPGHMISGLAERRNIGDGGHCKEPCLYTINDRITDLGRIMATTSETESLELIRKYQGNSPKAYWIASEDLVQKFRWIEYFGMGCDGTGIYTQDGPNKCPLYQTLGQVNIMHNPNGEAIATIYSNGYVNITVLFGPAPLVYVTEGINAALFEEVIFYRDVGEVINLKVSDLEEEFIQGAIENIGKQLGIRFSNQTISSSVWISRDFRRIVIIPANMRNNVFTRMFFLEGGELEHFKQVYRNEYVKIYEIV
jgi:hypothetical protein